MADLEEFDAFIVDDDIDDKYKDYAEMNNIKII
jgi:DeoR/GlpR family transcriptional regulator of sugar metabolism